MFECSEHPIGRGISMIVCWSNKSLCPPAMVLFSRCTNGLSGVETRNRIDVLQFYISNNNAGEALMNQLKKTCNTIHVASVSDDALNEFLKKNEFEYTEASLDWTWSKPMAQPLESGPQLDGNLAILLGWMNVKVSKKDDVKLVVGIPPDATAESLPIAIPPWSTDLPLALALLIELSEKCHFDYKWWKLGGNYSVGVRSHTDGGTEFSEDETSLWYKSLPLAIVDALANHLKRIWLAEQELKASLNPQG